MNRALVITGVVLLVLGVATIGYSILGPRTDTILAFPSDTNPFPAVLTPSTVSVSWSGGTSSTYVVLFQCKYSNCTSIETVLANRSGASGSFSATLQPGQSYAWTAYGGTAVSATYTLSGVTVTVLLGIVLAVVGAVVAALGAMRKKRGSSEAVAAWDSTPAPSEPAEVPQERASETAAEAEASAASNSTPAPTESGGRANRKCGHCGTMNEPWITNCRKCKRPLASTSTS